MKALLILALILVASNAATEQEAAYQKPDADAGGPYYTPAGIETVLDASGSSGPITDYEWDYGDGTTGTGQKTEHTYAKEGTYAVTLTVTDETGNKDTTTSAVHVKPVDIYIDITAQPRQERYEPGDTITAIEADIRYSNGKKIDGVTVTGTLTGKEKKTLTFKETGGKYFAEINHFIKKGEAELINITVEAKDAKGNRKVAAKKLVMEPVNTESLHLEILPRGPFAYGQDIELQAIFQRLKDHKSMDEGNVILYEGWSEKTFPFERGGRDYFLTYRIAPDSRESLNFIIAGRGRITDSEYYEVKDFSFDVTGDLSVKIIAPEKDSYIKDAKNIAIEVAYPDGTLLGGEELSAYIDGEPATFKRTGDVYTCDQAANESSLDVWVFDGTGNAGGTKTHLSTVNASSSTQILYAVIPLVGIIAVLFLAYKAFERRRERRAGLMKEYEEARQRVESLKAVTNNVMHEFYTRKISEEDARKRVLDCEKELVLERRKLKEAMKKLGMKEAKEEKEEKKEPAEEKEEGKEAKAPSSPEA